MIKILKEKDPELADLLAKAIKGKWLKAPFSIHSYNTGRNAPCPCGSGKKYKKCCLPGKGYLI